MPLQNRVTPLSDLVATPARGLVYGNRGCLHDDAGRIRRRYGVRRWIACRLEFQGWHREPLLQPGRFTELFFLDDATALAAGHRPCALCRRADYDRFVADWRRLHSGPADADSIDRRLHDERLDPVTGGQRHHEAAAASLPDGAFVLLESEPWLVLGDSLLRWTASGYAERIGRPQRGTVVTITPPTFVQQLRAGRDPLVPAIHPSAYGPVRMR